MRALVLGGGGSKGAFAVGAIEVLRNAGVMWDIIVGCSTGALIAPMVALSQAGDPEAFPELLRLYTTVTNDQIYTPRSLLSIVEGHHSCLDSAPLWHLITAMMTPARYTALCTSPIGVYLLTTSMQQGLLVYWTQRQSLPVGETGATNQALFYAWFVRAMLASASQPGLFPLVEIRKDHEQYCDGGVCEVVPLSLPISLGADIIDVIMLSPEEEPPQSGVFTTFVGTLSRTLDVLITRATATDLRLAEFVNAAIRHQQVFAPPQRVDNPDVPNPLQSKRLVELHEIRPEHVLTENSLEFNPIAMTIMAELGRDAARAALGRMR